MSSVHSEQKKDGEKKSRLGEGREEGGCDENDGIIGGWAEGRERERMRIRAAKGWTDRMKEKGRMKDK